MSSRDDLEQRRRDREANIRNISDEILRAIGDLIDIDRDLRDSLAHLKSNVRSFMSKYELAKVASTSGKLVGSAAVVSGVVLLPFTLGWSSALIGVGSSTVAASSVADFVTEWINSVETQDFIERLKSLARRHDKAIDKLRVGVNRLVPWLEASASNNDALPTHVNVIRAIAITLSMVILIPAVRTWLHTQLVAFAGVFGLSLTPLDFFAKFASKLFIPLLLISSVSTIVVSIIDLVELSQNRAHPVEALINDLDSQLLTEIDELKQRKEYV